MVLISLQTRLSNWKLAVKVKFGGGRGGKALSENESFRLEIRFLTVIAE